MPSPDPTWLRHVQENWRPDTQPCKGCPHEAWVHTKEYVLHIRPNTYPHYERVATGDRLGCKHQGCRCARFSETEVDALLSSIIGGEQ